MINTSAYSFAVKTFGDKVEKIVSLYETFVGIGCTSGPVIGSILYQYFGFELTFFIFGGMMATTAFLILFILPRP